MRTADLVHGDDLVRQADLAVYKAKRQKAGPVACGTMIDKPATPPLSRRDGIEPRDR